MQTNRMISLMVAERGTPGEYIRIGGWSEDVLTDSKAK